jgi:hypothetical protein
VDENQRTPECVKEKWWVESLRLSATDLERLQNGRKVTDSLMNASQKLLKQQFPECHGLQDVTLGSLLMFSPLQQRRGTSIQILHTGE